MRYHRILSVMLTGVLLCGTISYAAEASEPSGEGIQGISEDPVPDMDMGQDSGDVLPGGGSWPWGDDGTDQAEPDAGSGDVPDDLGQPGEEEPDQINVPGQADAGNGQPLREEDEVKMEAEPDAGTQKLLDRYERWLSARAKQPAAGDYASELAKFPESYRGYLEELHKKHPDWIFVAIDTGLNWNSVVKAEASGNRSLIYVTSGHLLLSRASGDYNASRGTYIPKDGVTWVTASRPAIAYYADPRNFLTDEYIYMFEALDYNKTCHSIEGVEAILKGTELANKKVSYTNTKGKKVSTKKTYGQLIYAAGADNKVSPLFLAAKIRQETGGSLKYGSISGNFSYGGKSYLGYYNFYNIGATSTSTGSAVANGLSYAKSSGKYGRPWTSPVKSIDGGAKFLAESYIGRGQNTMYFEKFNTAVEPYYQNQYMQNISGAAAEARETYHSYHSMGIVDNPYVFYIPVYKNMPSQKSKAAIKKSVKTGTVTGTVNLRKGPSTSYKSLVTIPKDAKVTVSGGVFTDKETTVLAQQANPYWVKVTYKSKTGYISASYLKMNTDKTVKVGGKKQLSVSGVGKNETVFYESSNPAVATVDSQGVVKGVKKGVCMVYAISGSAKTMDIIGIKVGSTSVSNPSPEPSSPAVLTAPKLKSAVRGSSDTKVTWGKVPGAEGYYVYRKEAGGKWSKTGTVKGQNQVSYTDKTAEKGKTYYYTVRAYKGDVKSSYDKNGIEGKKEKYADYKATAALLYRKGPGTSYAKKGTLKKGASVKVVKGWSKKANGYTWYKIYKDKGYYYAASEFLKKK